MSDEPTDSVHEPLVGAPAPHSGDVRAGDDAILAKDDSVLNLGVGDVDVASKAAVTGPCLPVCFPYYPGGTSQQACAVACCLLYCPVLSWVWTAPSLRHLRLFCCAS